MDYQREKGKGRERDCRDNKEKKRKYDGSQMIPFLGDLLAALSSIAGTIDDVWDQFVFSNFFLISFP
jgi:hypothetical protein